MANCTKVKCFHGNYSITRGHVKSAVAGIILSSEIYEDRRLFTHTQCIMTPQSSNSLSCRVHPQYHRVIVVWPSGSAIYVCGVRENNNYYQTCACMCASASMNIAIIDCYR